MLDVTVGMLRAMLAEGNFYRGMACLFGAAIVLIWYGLADHLGWLQVPMGLAGMAGAAMQQSQPYQQRQMLMQGHQPQPGQQAYPMAYQTQA